MKPATPWTKWFTSKALADVAVAGSVAALAVYHLRRRLAASRTRRDEAASGIQTWEGEGGNVVAPQSGETSPADRAVTSVGP